MNLLSLNPKNIEKYNKFIYESEISEIYHTLGWMNVTKNTYNFKPLYFLSEENDEFSCVFNLFEVNGLLKGKRLISIPFSHSVPIISKNDFIKKESINNLLSTLSNKYNYIEFRDNIKDFSENVTISNENCISVVSIKDFKSSDEYFKSLADTNKRNIKKAIKNIEIKIGNSVEDYENFYKIIRQTRTRQGSPLYPKKLFSEIHSELNKETLIFNAFHNNRLCASIMIFYHNNKALYSYGGSFDNPEAILQRPMNLLLWEAIKYSFNQQHSVFDLGSAPKFHTGLINFKKQFTQNIYDIPTSVIHCKKQKSIKRDGSLGKIVSFVIRKSPEWVNEMIGPSLLKEGV
ncbi:MAG: GNAT family N-acetyltransferase [Alphaproteobacteria bacterium]|jgi:lipid II:glycine glycyltransferase (peptidoglycan interpeptide bridge formation enzyme)|nr:GNAT family N-acetyltransferase [Alphaproteobacteria bacterium]